MYNKFFFCIRNNFRGVFHDHKCISKAEFECVSWIPNHYTIPETGSYEKCDQSCKSVNSHQITLEDFMNYFISQIQHNSVRNDTLIIWPALVSLGAIEFIEKNLLRLLGSLFIQVK